MNSYELEQMLKEDDTNDWILSWNPKRFKFDGYEQLRELIKNTGPMSINWTVRNKKIKPGDTVYLLMLGQKEKNGIIGYEYAQSVPYICKWEDDYGKMHDCYMVDVELHNLVDLNDNSYVLQTKLKGLFPQQCWAPQSSGISIKNKYKNQIRKMIIGEK